jgi:hypothetical protein
MAVVWGAAATAAYGQTAGGQGEAAAKPKVKTSSTANTTPPGRDPSPR